MPPPPTLSLPRFPRTAPRSHRLRQELIVARSRTGQRVRRSVLRGSVIAFVTAGRGRARPGQEREGLARRSKRASSPPRPACSTPPDLVVTHCWCSPRARRQTPPSPPPHRLPSSAPHCTYPPPASPRSPPPRAPPGYSGKRFVFEKAAELGVSCVVLDAADSWARVLEAEGVIAKFVPIDFADAATVFEQCMQVEGLPGRGGHAHAPQAVPGGDAVHEWCRWRRLPWRGCNK
jgi:hypothetical protein